jgi:hypothetical protein
VVRYARKCVMQNRCSAFLCAIILVPSSCAPRQTYSQARHEELARTQTGSELFIGLLALDQEYPYELGLKVDLGAHLLAAGELEKARVYLEAGERLAARTRINRLGAGAKNRRLAALLYADLAELSWRTKQYREAADYSSVSLSLDSEDPAGALFTRAKARAALRENGESLADFAKGWESRRSTMVPEDYRVYWGLLSNEGRNGEALATLAAYQERFPYEQGIGLAESLLYERTGLIEESVLAAFKELEYQRCAGSSTEARMLAGLGDLARKLEDPAFNPGRRGKRLVGALGRYVKGEWPGALAELSSIASVSVQPFGRYLLLSAQLEAGKATSGDFQSYLSLEPSLRSLASYYHHLWRGLKACRGPEAANAAVDIVEKCILLAPRTGIAAEARRELGRVRGLSPADGEKLLLGAELEQIARAVESGADAALLEPVLALLTTPDNSYQAAGTRMLEALKADARVKAFLEERRKDSAGRLKERLAFLLGD